MGMEIPRSRRGAGRRKLLCAPGIWTQAWNDLVLVSRAGGARGVMEGGDSPPFVPEIRRCAAGAHPAELRRRGSVRLGR